MKFLICGIGSAGQRHYKNLKSLGHECALFRSRKTSTPFIDDFLKEQKEAGMMPETFFDLDEALQKYRPDAVVITNPNAYHMVPALKAAKAGCHIFLEKPVSHTLENIAEFQKIVSKKRLIVAVGYMLRFHPLLVEMKKRVEAGDIGKPLAAHVENAENIEDWHPWEDYATTYAPYIKSGGGVILCFSHEIDYLYWFFGIPVSIFAIGGKITPLVGDGEDMVKSILTFKNNIIVSLHLDYWQRPRKRVFEIVGTKGKIIWNYYAHSLSIIPREINKKEIVIKVPVGFDRNDMFLKEMENFIISIRTKKIPKVPLDQAIDVLKLSLNLKKKLRL